MLRAVNMFSTSFQSFQYRIGSLVGGVCLTAVWLTPAIAQSSTSLPVFEPAVGPPAAGLVAQPRVRQAGAANPEYVLGAGDQVRLDIYDVSELSGLERTVLVDGSLTFPWIGKVMVAGLTPDAAQQRIALAYTRFINNLILTFEVTQPRPLRIGIVGEVRRPGGYTLDIGAGGSEGTGDSGAYWPSLTQAISAAGGVTQSADVRDVKIQRSTGELVSVNLWTLLQTGSLTEDVPLLNGDQIVIPVAVDLSAAEITNLSASSLAPKTVQVNVVGQVVNPGPVEVPLNTPLNQAILAAGGFNTRSQKSNVELIRLNANGTVTRRTVSVDLAQAVNEDTNPLLRERDTVIVDRSGLVETTDTLGVILSPLTGILGLLNLIF